MVKYFVIEKKAPGLIKLKCPLLYLDLPAVCDISILRARVISYSSELRSALNPCARTFLVRFRMVRHYASFKARGVLRVPYLHYHPKFRPGAIPSGPLNYQVDLHKDSSKYPIGMECATSRSMCNGVRDFSPRWDIPLLESGENEGS